MTVRLKAELINFFEVLVFPLALMFFNPTYSSLGIGLVLAALSLALKIWLFAYPKKRNKKFQVYGPYRFMRHPYFCSTFLILLAAAFSSRSVALFLLSMVSFTWVFIIKTREIDRHRREVFSVDYVYYKNVIGSIIPSLIPYPEKSQKKASLKNIFNIRYKVEADSFVVVAIYFSYAFAYLAFRSLRDYHPIFIVVLGLLAILRISRYIKIDSNKKGPSLEVTP